MTTPTPPGPGPVPAPLAGLADRLRLDSRTVRSAVVGLGLVGALFGVDVGQAVDVSQVVTDLAQQVDIDEGLRLALNAGVALSLLGTWVFRVKRRAP
jgi:hypothetical protein